MVQKTAYTMRFRRRREGKTDYKKRLALLKSGKPRLIVRVRGRSVVAQIVRFTPKGDLVAAGATSADVAKLYGFAGHAGNAEAAYLVGMLCGKRALKAGVKDAVLDIGLHTPVAGSNVFAALKGAVEAGLDVPHSDECFPPAEKVKTGAGKAALEKMAKGV